MWRHDSSRLNDEASDMWHASPHLRLWDIDATFCWCTVLIVCSTRTRQYFCVRQYFAVYYTQSRQYTIVCTTHNQNSTLTLTRLRVGVLSWLCAVHERDSAHLKVALRHYSSQCDIQMWRDASHLNVALGDCSMSDGAHLNVQYTNYCAVHELMCSPRTNAHYTCAVHQRDSTQVSMWHWRSRWFSLV